MIPDIPTGIAIAGLLVALAVALPSILAFWREKRSRDGVETALDELNHLRDRVEELRRHAILATKCIEKSNFSVSVQRSAFAELIRNKDANWDIADQIFNEQDRLTRRAFLHLQLESSSLEVRRTAAHILATEMGNAESVIHMKESLALLNDVDREFVEMKILQLAKRVE
jgi:hypothetical protein